MRKLLFISLMFFTILLSAQYSTYYGTYDINHNLNATIKKDVNVSGSLNVNKTINTIDYGQLAVANAQKEKNRLDASIYSNKKERQIALEISGNPAKAFDYGYSQGFELKGKEAKRLGFKRLKGRYVVPHSSLFISAGNGRFENISIDGITTEIIFQAIQYNINNDSFNVEKRAKMESMIVGEVNKDGDNIFFVHRKDTKRATVYGLKGFIGTLVWEDDYEKTITDNYEAYNPRKGNGIYYAVKVRTYGDKDEVTFEDLEGRRYYMQQLVRKVVASGKTWDEKF